MIAHYFPPGTSSGTLRTVKFAKYLPEWDWQPYILTMRPEAYHPDRYDSTLLREISPNLKVYRTPVWMPDRTLAKLKRRALSIFSKRPDASSRSTGGPPKVRPRRKVDHLRDWLQFPDAYGGWLIPGLREGQRAMASEKVDLIYSSAPSPVAHMIAMGLHKWTGCPWVADFRDPWECLFPETVYVEGEHPWRRRAEVAVAEKVVRTASLVVANTNRLCEAFRDRFPDVPGERFVTIPNGFDPEDSRCFASKPEPNSKFTLSYTGTFFGELRSPDEVLQAIQMLVQGGLIDPEKLCIRFVGCGTYSKPAARYVQVVPRVGHNESLKIMNNSDVLLLLQQSPKYWLQVPAKTYEYLAARRWILAVAPEGATRDIIASQPNGIVVPPQRPEELKSALLKLYRMYLSGSLYPVPACSACTEQFSRREQTHILSTYFSQLVEYRT